MVDFLSNVLIFLRTNIFLAFGIYSIGFFLLKIIASYKIRIILTSFDQAAIKLVIYSGILYFVIWILGSSWWYIESDVATRQSYFDRISGPYWFGVLLSPFSYLFLTQLLRIHIFNKYLIFRIIISLCLVPTFELYVIIVTSFHQDYMSFNLLRQFNFTPAQIIISLTIKLLIFIGLTGLLFYILKQTQSYKKNEPDLDSEIID